MTRGKKIHAVIETYSHSFSLIQKVQESDGVGAASSPSCIFPPATLSTGEDPAAHLPCFLYLPLRSNPSQWSSHVGEELNPELVGGNHGRLPGRGNVFLKPYDRIWQNVSRERICEGGGSGKGGEMRKPFWAAWYVQETEKLNVNERKQ